MKILMIVPGLDKRLGGTTTLSIGFFDELKKLAEVTMVCTYFEHELAYIEDRFKSDAQVHLFPAISQKVKFSKEQYLFTKQHIKSYDLVHVHGLWHMMAYPSASLAMKNQVPYIMSPHGMLEPDAMKRSRLKKVLFWKLGFKKVFRNASAVHCTAKSEIGNTKQYATNANIIFVSNGVNLPEKQYQKIANQFLFIGRLHPKKAVNRLIEAFSMLNDPSLKLIIAGTGSAEYETSLRELIKAKKLETQIEMVGFVDGEAKQKWIAESLFVCVPSFSEGMPLVSLETMATGTPLLITKASNVPEVTEYDCGIELEDNEPASIAKGLKELLSSDLSQKSKNAAALVTEKFLWSKVGRALYQEYQNLLKK
ncbi:MAG: glycosyltransferase [Cyclobacteriaceae bacterium]